MALGATDLRGLIPAFILLGVGLASDHVSRLNIILEFAVPEDQPTFIGLTNTLLAPVVFLAPIFGGWLADFGFETLFILMAGCGLAGGFLLFAWVSKNRDTSRPSQSAPSGNTDLGARPDADVTDSADRLVEQNLNWNFSVNVLDNMFYALAISLVSQETIMPLLVSELTDSTIAVGLIPAIFSLSFLLPQLFVANHAERLPRKLPFVLLGSGLLQRLPYPLIGIALLLFAVEAPGLALLLFFIGIATAAFGGGIVTPAWFSMIGKVVPTRRRGIFFGLADGGGLLMAVIGAYFVGRVLDFIDYPGSFALLFLVAGVIHAISWFSLSLTREPPSDVVKKAVQLRHYFRRLPSVLRGHANFRRFLIGYALLRLSMMAVSFFIVFGNINYQLTGADIGLLNAIFIGTQALMRLLFGWLGDRWGHKRNLVISALCMALAAAFALNSSSSRRVDSRLHLPRLRHLQRYGFPFQHRAGIR